MEVVQGDSSKAFRSETYDMMIQINASLKITLGYTAPEVMAPNDFPPALKDAYTLNGSVGLQYTY